MKATGSHKLEWITVRDLHPWSRCQRPLDAKRAARIAADFDPDLLGIPVVMVRDGAYWILDGQHRIEALRLLGWSEQMVQCEVLDGITDARAAKLFGGRNDDVSLQALPRFTAAVVAGEADAVAVNEIVESVGLRVAIAHDDGVAAVKALMGVYRPRSGKATNGDALRNTLEIIKASWGASRETMQAPLISGLGMVFTRHNGGVDKNVMRQKLARYPGGASGLIGDARGVRQVFGGSLPHAVATIAVSEYNKSKRTQRLPDWRVKVAQ